MKNLLAMLIALFLNNANNDIHPLDNEPLLDNKPSWYKPSDKNTIQSNADSIYRWLGHTSKTISQTIQVVQISEEKLKQMLDFEKKLMKEFKVTPKTGFPVVKYREPIIDVKEFE